MKTLNWKLGIASLFVCQLGMALPGGSPVCEVLADYSNITSMTNRTRHPNSGSYMLTANVSEYTTFEHVEITIAGDPFVGLMFTVVDAQGNLVGEFSPDTQVGDCGNAAMSITHTSSLSLSQKTLFWIPPSEAVGSVYVLGYVLEGSPGGGSSQNFYRFVREDDSALELTPSEVIYRNGFE